MANRSRSRPGYSHPHLSSLAICFSPSASPFPVRYSLLLLASVSLSNSPTPDEERAERRWRSDACEAPVSACHDRHADASSICANRANPPCVLCAPRADPACDRFAQTGQPPGLHEASCVPSDGTLAFRRSTWDFWPGPVLAVLRPPPPELREIGTARLKPLSKASRGSLGSPSGIVRLSPHGSSLPEGAGLASLPGAAANRTRGHHSLARHSRIASRSAPHEQC